MINHKKQEQLLRQIETAKQLLGLAVRRGDDGLRERMVKRIKQLESELI